MPSTLGTTNSAYSTGENSVDCPMKLYWDLCWSTLGSAGQCWAWGCGVVGRGLKVYIDTEGQVIHI